MEGIINGLKNIPLLQGLFGAPDKKAQAPQQGPTQSQAARNEHNPQATAMAQAPQAEKRPDENVVKLSKIQQLISQNIEMLPPKFVDVISKILGVDLKAEANKSSQAEDAMMAAIVQQALQDAAKQPQAPAQQQAPQQAPAVQAAAPAPAPAQNQNNAAPAAKQDSSEDAMMAALMPMLMGALAGGANEQPAQTAA